MLHSYFKVALRNIRKQKLFSFINVFGLSFSLAICVIIILMLADQYSYDAFNTNSDRIYRINHTRPNMDAIISGMATSPLPIGAELKSNYTGVKSYCRLYRGFGNSWIKLMQDVNIPISGFYADPNVFDMFQYPLLYGDKETALAEPNTVVLTLETAQKLFKEDNPVGKVIKVGDLGNYKITGVMRELRGKTHIKFDGLASMASVSALEAQEILPSSLDNWRNSSRGWTYLSLEHGKDPKEIESFLAEISEKQYGAMEDLDPTFSLQNLRAINPGPFLGNQIGPGIPMFFVYFLSGLALVIMMAACFNYTNLSIARSMSRAREVGIRKIFGAERWQIFTQFLMESVVIALMGFLLSIGIVQFLKPVFLELNFSQLFDWDLRETPKVYLICLLFSVFVGILAGFLPAAFHSSVKAMQGLKNLAGMAIFSNMGIRKFLIVAQFGLSLFLIITVKLIYDQMDHMIHKEYGFNAENNVVIKLSNTSYDRLKRELLSFPNLISVTGAGFTPASGISSSLNVRIEEEEKEINYFDVDEDYIDNMDLKLVAGRNFKKDFHDKKIVINRKAVGVLGFESPHDVIGQSVTLYDSIDHEVIGVIEDYHHETLLSDIRPMMLIHRPEEFGIVQVKVNATNLESAIANIETAWSNVNPDLAMEYKLLSDEITFFAELIFGDLSKVVGFVSFLAIVISCLGLMGMVVFNVNTRLKEVSIRKVLGASNQLLVFILSRGFIKLLGLSVLLSLPLSYFINNLWLDFIAYRVPIGLDVLLFGVMMVLLLGLLVIGSQTWRAANTNPAEILRDE